jgi:Mg-chelatase subunit ChlI
MDVLGINTSLHLATAAARKSLLDHPENLPQVMQDRKAVQEVATLEGTTAVTTTRRQGRRAMRTKKVIPHHRTRKTTQIGSPDKSSLEIPSRSRTVAARTNELAPAVQKLIEKVALDGLQNI